MDFYGRDAWETGPDDETGPDYNDFILGTEKLCSPECAICDDMSQLWEVVEPPIPFYGVAWE